MKFLETPAATLAAMAFAIFTFGIGLTSPIWLMVTGKNPLDAIHTGTPIVIGSILGLMVTVGLGVLAGHLRKPTEAIASSDPRIARSARSQMVVHVVVMMMFIIPFLTIVLGFVLKRLIDFDAG